MSTIAPREPALENRRLLSEVLDFYGAKSVEELNSKDNSAYWSEKLWDTWKFTFHDWGCYSQTFDMTQPKDGVFRVVEHFGGERRFFRDKETGEVGHEKRYQKPEGEEYKTYALPKSENHFEDGLAMLPEGPMMATVRLFGYPPYGHGTVGMNQLRWGAPIVSQISLQPDDQIRLSVLPLFITPPASGAKGALLKVNVFRDDTGAKPFSKSLNWINDAGDAVIRKIDLEQATKTVFPFPGDKSVRGFAMKAEMAKGCRLTIKDGSVFDLAALGEGGEDAQFYAMNQNVLLNIVQAPEQGKPYAVKWRLLWRLGKRLMVGVITYNAETLKPEPEMHEYAY
ncbi:hypothetical protein AcW1_009885 [Taiwanofungus camphoratus]|nr:hypothetical protein AcW1_009885 [Antrodia cinnamomea]KAI0946418.1 hypothetical protein AcW1_009885 [Antrodia cinnamomea]